jgi:N-methylhydantoinase B/oxoprolinase/acetone carboxylase alpha subunit
MTTAQTQQQIWHRVNTSLIGDTVQVGFTLSDAQMRDPNNAQMEITLHAMQLDIHPAGWLA